MEDVPVGSIGIHAYDNTQHHELEGADILVDGVQRPEKTPAFLKGIATGEHEIRIRPPDLMYPEVDTIISYTSPDTISITLMAERSDVPGELTVMTSNDPAWIFINESFRSYESPLLLSLAPGIYRVAGFRERFVFEQPAQGEVEIRAEQRIELHLSLMEKSITPWVNGLAPDICLPNDLGDSCRIAQFRGNILLINFAGFRCDPCLTELPQIQQVYNELFSEGFRVLVINTGWWHEGPEDFTSLREELGITLPLLYPENDRANATILYEVQVAPTNIIVDRTGIIRFRFSMTNYEELKTLLMEIL